MSKPKVYLDMSSVFQKEYHDKIREHLVEIKTLTLDTKYCLCTSKGHKNKMKLGIKIIFEALDMIHESPTLVRIDKKRCKKRDR